MKPLLVALAAFLIAAPLGAQGQAQTQGQTQQPTFRTGVDVITVDVGVIDSRGQPVTDLHAPEFTVKIDGQVRRVVSADLVKYDYTPDTGGVRRMQEVTNRECRGLLDMALEQCMRDIVDESNSILWTTRRDSEASLRGLRDWLQHLGETEGQKTLILLSEGLVTDSPSDLEDVVRTAMRGRIQ